MVIARRVIPGVGIVVAILLLIGSLAVFQSARTADAQQAALVVIGDNTFTSPSITVAAGSTVTWSHQGQRPHTVTSDTRVFDSGGTSDKFLRPGGTFSFTFTQPGTYGYVCILHAGMAGTVVVTGSATQPAPPTVAPTPASQAVTSITVPLGPGRNASQPGSAILTAKGNQTEVVLNVQAGPGGVQQPAHIHTGTCATLGGVKYPLTNVVDGKSTTMVDVPLASLRTGDFAINVHKSAQEVDVYVSCGNIPLAAAAGPAPGSSGNAGLKAQQSDSDMPWALVAIATTLVLGAGGLIALRERRSR